MFDDQHCMECDAGYYLLPEKTGCVQTDATKHCDVAIVNEDSLFLCEECSEGYYLKKDRSCQANSGNDEAAQNIANCKRLDFDKLRLSTPVYACVECHGGYQSNNGNCEAKAINECQTYKYSDSTKCETCNTGFLPNELGSVCHPMTDVQKENCKYAKADNKCGECADNRYGLKSDDICQTNNVGSNTKLCKTYDSSNVCTSCWEQFDLKSDNTCERYHKVSGYVFKDPYCLEASSADVCTKCMEPRHANGTGECVLKIEFCEDYNEPKNPYKCTRCKDGFAVNHNENNNKCFWNDVANCQFPLSHTECG